MNEDDRNSNRSFVNCKWLDYPGRLVASADAERETLSNDFDPVVLVPFVDGDTKSLFALGRDSIANLSFYSSGVGGSFSETRRATVNSNIIQSAVTYNDGTDDYVYGIDNTGDVLRVLARSPYTVEDDYDNAGTSGGQQLIGYHPVTDKVYHMSNYDLRSISGTTLEGKILDAPSSFSYHEMVAYKDRMVFFASRTGETGLASIFYDVINAPNSIDDVVAIGAFDILTAGVIDGRLAVLGIEPDPRNDSECAGYIKLKLWDGGKFRDASPGIQFGLASTIKKRGSSDGKYMYYGFSGEDEINAPGVYRFAANGEVKCMGAPTDLETTSEGSISDVVSVGGTVVVAYDTDSAHRLAQFFSNSGTADHEDESVYITNFLEDPYETKHLTSLAVSFEPLTSNQVVTVSYRTNPTESFTEILNASFAADGAIDRKQVVFNNADVLPEFKEVQFRITSEENAKITSARYRVDFINDDHE